MGDPSCLFTIAEDKDLKITVGDIEYCSKLRNYFGVNHPKTEQVLKDYLTNDEVMKELTTKNLFTKVMSKHSYYKSKPSVRTRFTESEDRFMIYM